MSRTRYVHNFICKECRNHCSRINGERLYHYKFCSQSCFGKYNIKSQKKTESGFFDLKRRKLAYYKSFITNKTNKTGIFNPEVRRLANINSHKSFRKNRPFWFFSVPFASNLERTFAKKVYLNFGIRPRANKNCHIRLDGGEIDFYLFNTFIEIHVFHKNSYNRDRWYKTYSKYMKERLALLEKNGFSKSELIILQNTEDMDIFLDRQKNKVNSILNGFLENEIRR
jgi:hypothetical protein